MPWFVASLAFHRGCKYLCGSKSAPAPVRSPPPLPQSHPTYISLVVNLPHLVPHPRKSPATNGGDLFTAPQGHRTASERLMVNKTPTLPTHQCVGYPVAPIPGWLASILPFNPCVGSITPPLVMVLMPVHPALAGK